MTEKTYSNTTTYFRAKNDGVANYYTVISNDLIRDKRLSSDEIIIMVTILSNNNTYVLNMDFLRNYLRWSGKRFYKASEILQKYKYLEKVRGRGTCNWIVREEGDKMLIINSTVDSNSITTNSAIYNIDEIDTV